MKSLIGIYLLGLALSQSHSASAQDKSPIEKADVTLEFIDSYPSDTSDASQKLKPIAAGLMDDICGLRIPTWGWQYCFLLQLNVGVGFSSSETVKSILDQIHPVHSNFEFLGSIDNKLYNKYYFDVSNFDLKIRLVDKQAIDAIMTKALADKGLEVYIADYMHFIGWYIVIFVYDPASQQLLGLWTEH